MEVQGMEAKRQWEGSKMACGKGGAGRSVERINEGGLSRKVRPLGGPPTVPQDKVHEGGNVNTEATSC